MSADLYPGEKMTLETEPQNPPSPRRYPIWLTTLIGAVVLSLFSVPQKITMGAPYLEFGGYLVPVLFGGLAGLVLGILNGRLRSSFIKQLHDQTAATQKLCESEERFRLLAENARDVIFRWNLVEHRYQYVSPAVYTLTGHMPEDFLSNPRLFEELIIPDDRQTFHELNRQIAQGEVSPHVEYRMTHKQGHIVWINQRHAFGFDNDGKVVSLEGICTDVTQYHTARQEKQDLETQLLQSQKMDALGRLAGGIAHDFNNLLTVINGYSDLLIMEFEDQEEKPVGLKEIQKAGQKAADLTTQLLTFSRKQILTPRLIDPTITVRDSMRMLSRMLGEDIHLQLNIAVDLPNIYMDRTQLDQVLLNLVINAREAMPEGGTLTVALSIGNTKDHLCAGCQKSITGSFLSLIISDTGTGMEDSVKNRIFDPFFTTKDVNQGTGMGLSTVHGIVHQNKGHIEVDSTPGQGTRFTILLPVITGDSDVPPDEPTIFSPQLQGNETILMVEDEPLVRSLTTKVLQQYGYNVLISESGKEALELFKTHRETINLLLTDVVMPGMSGVELSREILKQEPQLKVIFMSGYVDNKLNLTGISNSSHPFLKKPFGSEALARIVRQTLDNNHG